MKGIRRTPTGWQVFIRIAGRFCSKRFNLDTPIETMILWRKQRAARAVLKLDEPVEGPTFAEDVTLYLQAVQGMTSISDRTYHMNQWVAALGRHQPRQAITALWIRQQLESWRVRKPSPLSAGSLNRRRTALMHFWTVTEGRAAINPVRDVPKYREIVPPLRLPTLAEAEKAITAVGHRWKLCKGRDRLRVLLWTGWPAAQLKQIIEADLKLDEQRAWVHGRCKGKGSRARWLPLLPQAVEALRRFSAVNAFGSFSNSSLHSALHRGCELAGVPKFRTYDLRHLFAVLVATSVKDDRIVSELLMHSNLEQVRRYTENSVDPRLTAALEKVAEELLDGAPDLDADPEGQPK